MSYADKIQEAQIEYRYSTLVDIGEEADKEIAELKEALKIKESDSVIPLETWDGVRQFAVNPDKSLTIDGICYDGEWVSTNEIRLFGDDAIQHVKELVNQEDCVYVQIGNNGQKVIFTEYRARKHQGKSSIIFKFNYLYKL